MEKKPSHIERTIVLARDHRRKYGVRIRFRVLHPQHIGSLSNVSLLFADGKFGTISPVDVRSSELGVRHELAIEGYATAAEAEATGMLAAQALLLSAINLNFGICLDYSNHEPPTVFDRTVSSGHFFGNAELVVSWPEPIVLETLVQGFTHNLRDRRTILSMELFAASNLESNERAKFVMAVSALEPLAEQEKLGPEIARYVDRAIADLDADDALPQHLRQSLRGRVQQLRRESVRQALTRLCSRWFPGDTIAREEIDHVYALRSQILHEGRVSDLDVILAQELRKTTKYLRRIYELEFGVKFRVSTDIA